MEYTSRSIVVVMRFEHFLFIVLQIYRHYCSRVVVFRRPFCYSEGRCVSWRRGVDERILETDFVGNLAEAPGKSGQEENGRATSRVNSAPIRRANVFSLSDFTATVADFKRELRQRGSCTKSIYTDFARGTRQETRSSRISNEDRNELRNWRKRVLAKGSPIRGSHPRNSMRYLIYVRIKFSFYFYRFRQREVSSHNFSEISSIIEESRKRLDSLEPKTQSLPLIRGSHPRNSTKCARVHTKFSTFYFLFPRISLPYSPKSNKRSFIDQNNQSTFSQTRVTLLNKIAGIEKLFQRSEKSEKKPI